MLPYLIEDLIDRLLQKTLILDLFFCLNLFGPKLDLKYSRIDFTRDYLVKANWLYPHFWSVFYSSFA